MYPTLFWVVLIGWLIVLLARLVVYLYSRHLARTIRETMEAEQSAARHQREELERAVATLTSPRFANVVGIDNAGNVITADDYRGRPREVYATGTFRLVQASGQFDYAFGTGRVSSLSASRRLSGEWTPYHPPKDNPHPFVIGAPNNEPLDIPYAPRQSPPKRNKNVGSAY